MILRYHEIYLPMPTSINKKDQVGKGIYNRASRTTSRVVTRSAEYKDWLHNAGRAYREQFEGGVVKLTGRLRVDYIFVWPLNGNGAGLTSDIGNREKVLSDFLQHKLIENDNQIDEQRQYRRLWGNKKPYAWVRITEIPDRRCSDPALLLPT